VKRGILIGLVAGFLLAVGLLKAEAPRAPERHTPDTSYRTAHPAKLLRI
jgi:hypothetical protein